MLRVLRVADLFDGIFSIEHTGFRPKPDPVGFLRLLRSFLVNSFFLPFCASVMK
jgi:FMN phosphatase YigB (HAD superfamily)